MARTLAEIYAEIVDYKDSQAPIQALEPTADTETQLLTDLNSDSKVAIWRLWAYITAAAIYTHEVLWDLFKKEVEDTAAAAHTGTARWYRDQLLLFQYGDALTYDSATGKYGYATITPANRIVKQAAVIEGNNGVVVFKAAKDNSGDLAGLTTMEKDSLESYIRKIRFAGTRFVLISGDGDYIRITASIYFDAVVTETTVKTNVETAIKAYVEGLPFNGEFLISKLEDAIQGVTGVNDVVISLVETKQETGDTYFTVSRAYVPQYGYFRFDATPGSTLDDTITYVAQ